MSGIVTEDKKRDDEFIEHAGPSGPVSISNPLSGLTREELLYQVDDFVDHFGLQADRALIKRGALLAQHHGDWELLAAAHSTPASISEKPVSSSEHEEVTSSVAGGELTLSEDEISHLKYEKAHPWSSLSYAMVMSAVVAAFGAWTQGGDQQANSAAVLGWTKVFHLDAAAGEKDFQKDNWISGLVSSGPFFGAFLCSVWLSDWVNAKFGRRGTLLGAAVFCIAGPIGSAGCNTWWELFICRLIIGLGVGLKEVTSPVFSAENSPTPVRGTLVMFWQWFTAFGIALHAGLNIALGPKNFLSHDRKWDGFNLSWRYQSAFAALPALCLISCIYLCPESPRWLISRGKVAKGWASLRRLRYKPICASRDLYIMYVQLLEEEAAIGKRGNYFKRFGELFYKNRIRQASLASFVVMISQQMCGINIIAFYAGTIFSDITHNEQKALWATFGFGLINFLFAIPALYTIDTFGRRRLMLVTFPLMFVFLLTAGLCMLIHAGTAKLGLVALFIYLFTMVYSPGAGPVPFTYSAEVFPISHREVGMAWAVFVNNFFGTVLSITFFRIYSVMTPTGAFGFYAGLNILAWIMIILWVPETKQLSLEDLDTVFAIPTTKLMRWNVFEEFPYLIKRWVFFNKSGALVPLARVDHY